MRKICALAILSLVAGSLPSSAQTTLTGCVKQNGQIRMASPTSPCGANEIQVSWNAPAGGGALKVVDANNVEIGPLVSSTEVALTTVTGQRLIAAVGPAGFLESAFALRVFLDSSCTGTSYSPIPPSPTFFQRLSVVGTTGTFVASAAASIPSPPAYWQKLGDVCLPGFNPIGPNLYAFTTIDLSSLRAPFRIQ